ncbi:orotate phosphoribosyltransferase [Pendulispora albinea]|uniref:Orotate phosphoribosyltransferase n=1 Tax=Pendulispora albinea TaxID=2741071 RepID=A0ABZ2M827_9BACT
MSDIEMVPGLAALFDIRRGHFELESGHHGDLWLELGALFLHPRRIARLAQELARRIAPSGVDAICGPLEGGAFLAQSVASELDIEFHYSEREKHSERGGLYSVAYRIPRALHAALSGKRVAVVDDVINAGSAIRATWTALEACGAKPSALGALLVLGSAAEHYARDKGVPLVSLGALTNSLWSPAECPLCKAAVPLDPT